MKTKNTDLVYIKSDNLLQDVQQIIETAQSIAYHAVDVTLIQRNWLLGRRIAEEEFQGEDRAKYGAEIVRKLSHDLTRIYGKGFDYSSLYKFTRFYKLFPGILDSVSPKSHLFLSWTHYRTLLQVENAEARNWYLQESAREMWSVRTLRKNLNMEES